MITFLDFIKEIDSSENNIPQESDVDLDVSLDTPNEETSTEEIKDKVTEGVSAPEDILRSNKIKIKSSDMDEDSYIILLYSKSDITKASKILKDNEFKVQIVGNLLYIS